MNKAEELIKKYNLVPNTYLKESPYNKLSPFVEGITRSQDEWLLEKWDKYIPTGWYGFSLDPFPDICADAIDEFLEYVEKECRNFEILQIKLKFGGLRMYMGNINENIQKQCDLLMSVMKDERLFY